MNIHEKYINRCIELAKNGLGTTYPNPLVGSVVVYDDKIVGEGWHQIAGGPHAEVKAINSVKDKTVLKKSTIYVSLEPCSHFGKTPPCSDLIISSGIKKVVIGTIDTYDKVSGRGIKKMIEAGCDVTVGVLQEECQELNKRFFTFHNKKRPYIILKWAESNDHLISPLEKDKKEPVWLTNQYARQLVHKWRSEEQGILVGTNTVLHDNPRLNTRDWKGNSPTRIVIDKTLKTYPNHSIWDGEINTIIFTEKQLNRLNSNITLKWIDFNKPIPLQICEELHKEGIQSLIIEGGAQTLQSYIDLELWDEARIFKSNIKLINGIYAPLINHPVNNSKKIIRNQLNFHKKHD
ncbi:diaminohydroxyphosphoribosylaminopyrimidine deaminase [Zhouia amylolytica]|uniref:Riboflavin biosynthesis protein RibD n=1 Tax=Zhouia amylolytica TaxID=376730 RepID=A0A1I6QX26_9FLAO|nr:bifunctional diaminohydroxyphosphoribosylaminopyrimidine deaminase/5-amino-6-(5-phosphoribosylamino)uracil reductase RibD [Zhouia amylolytica]MCQ0110846.1 bifunctional diaminohydroxyphosphoribosylaminopyrimidine deaminase/5-amino-6-(5-phosphoribosylamino)uracil reductase RibD [Zhouia amylolytica]SFS56940.1 diaminohydroxyphosphoribosylaminopyrimidine deaminase [Zhouia amylolytica]